MEQIITKGAFAPVNDNLKKFLYYNRVLVQIETSYDGQLELVVSKLVSDEYDLKKNIYNCNNGYINFIEYLKPFIGKRIFIYQSTVIRSNEMFRIRPIDFTLQYSNKYEKGFPKVYPYFTKSALIIPKVFTAPRAPNIISFEGSSQHYINKGIIVARLIGSKMRGRCDQFKAKPYTKVGYRTSYLKMLLELAETSNKYLYDFLYKGEKDGQMIFSCEGFDEL